MPTVTTVLFPPPVRAKVLDDGGFLSRSLQAWLFTLQNLLQLKTVDTSGGAYGEQLPAPGLNAATGQSNQNMEIEYKKISADSSVFTLTGLAAGDFPEGPQTLTAQYSKFRVKSDGTNWWLI